MKYNLCLLCNLMLLYNHAIAQKSSKDTSFILRENGAYYHAIFIEYNRSSPYYDILIRRENSPWDSSFYNDGVERLKSIKKLTHINLGKIPKDWHPLYMYKEKFYVYFPSDGMNNNWGSISDSIILQYAGGEMIVEAINNLEKVNNKQIVITSTGENGTKSNIYIHLINPEKGIAVFEFASQSKESEYRLMVATDKISSFPMIVNYCKEQKQNEIEFDKPDYKKLLRNF